MPIPRLQRATRDTTPLPDGDGRRALFRCGVLVLVLATIGAIAFATGDYGDLIDTRSAASLALEENAESAELQADYDAATDAARRGALRLLGFIAVASLAAWFGLIRARRVATRGELLGTYTLFVTITGALLLVMRLVVQQAIPGSTVWGVADLLILHLCACVCLPLSSRDATIPFAPLLVVWAVIFLLPAASEWDTLDRVVGIIMSPLLLVPGAAIANWRERRRVEDAERLELGQQVEHMGGELSRARIVHEAMFPESIKGHVAFEYEYQPIAEIGGDYVHAFVEPESERMTVTLLDVAGHGLAAALTVNRLFGELERILAEDPSAEPAEIMGLLNRYIYLTMAPHSMFATGTCMTIDPGCGTLTWVSAGHPPSFLRRLNGNVEDLPTTTILLGADAPANFDPAQESLTLSPGDVVIAYTDGAFEARAKTGAMFGMDGVRRITGFDPPPRSWPKFIAGAVANHHGGNVQDDVLIVAMGLVSKRVGAARSSSAVATR